MRRYTQAEARIYGLEGEITLKPTEDYNITVFGDYVNGRLFNLPHKYTRKLHDHYVGYEIDEDGFKYMISKSKLKGELIVQNPERYVPRMPPSRLGLRFNGQFTEHWSGFIEYTYAFPQRKTAVSLSVDAEPRKFEEGDEYEVEELLEGVDLNKYNPEGIDLSDDDTLEEFNSWLHTSRVNELIENHPVIKNKIHENSTDGYHLLNLGVNYQRNWGKIDYTISLSANNILNQKIYAHTSFLPYVPQMGRNYVLGIGVEF